MPFHRKFIGQPERLSRGPGPSERFAGALGATPGERTANIVGGAATVIPGAGLAARGVASGAKTVQAALASKRLVSARKAVAEATRNLNRLRRVKASAVKINTAKQQVNVAKDALRNVGGPARVAPRRVVPTMMQQRATMGLKKGGDVKPYVVGGAVVAAGKLAIAAAKKLAKKRLDAIEKKAAAAAAKKRAAAAAKKTAAAAAKKTAKPPVKKVSEKMKKYRQKQWGARQKEEYGVKHNVPKREDLARELDEIAVEGEKIRGAAESVGRPRVLGGVGDKPLKFKKGGDVKSSRNKSKIDGIARKGHTRAPHR